MDIDLEKFFDRVNHDLLTGRLAKRVKDKALLKLIRAFLNAGVMENGLVSSSEEGTPQGGPNPEPFRFETSKRQVILSTRRSRLAGFARRSGCDWPGCRRGRIGR